MIPEKTLKNNIQKTPNPKTIPTDIARIYHEFAKSENHCCNIPILNVPDIEEASYVKFPVTSAPGRQILSKYEVVL